MKRFRAAHCTYMTEHGKASLLEFFSIHQILIMILIHPISRRMSCLPIPRLRPFNLTLSPSPRFSGDRWPPLGSADLGGRGRRAGRAGRARSSRGGHRGAAHAARGALRAAARAEPGGGRAESRGPAEARTATGEGRPSRLGLDLLVPGTDGYGVRRKVQRHVT